MIKDIVSPESIQPGEKMMALNVVYFKGQKIKLKNRFTTELPFLKLVLTVFTLHRVFLYRK
jgi:hypothetical protein